MAEELGGYLGTGVIIMDAPEGQVTHYVFRRWGEDFGGSQYIDYQPGRLLVPRVMKKFIVFNPYPDPNCVDSICHINDASFAKTWSEVLAILEADYPGEARAAVIPDGTMQYMRTPE